MGIPSQSKPLTILELHSVNLLNLTKLLLAMMVEPQILQYLML